MYRLDERGEVVLGVAGSEVRDTVSELDEGVQLARGGQHVYLPKPSDRGLRTDRAELLRHLGHSGQVQQGPLLMARQFYEQRRIGVRRDGLGETLDADAGFQKEDLGLLPGVGVQRQVGEVPSA
ncbi:hypothetical protein ACWDHW_34220 [Streptomyces melanosporofaciens]